MNIRTIIPKEITILLLLAVILNVVRVLLFGSWSFIYILWNIFLAIIPFVISASILYYVQKKKGVRSVLVAGGIIWLLFFPNAPYIVTDIIHVGRGYSVRAIYDAFLLFTSAWTGLLLGFYSLFHMEQVFRTKYSVKKTELIMIIIILLASFGIYFGRFFRFNSWDIVADPITLWQKILGVFIYPFAHGIVYAYVILFFVFIYGTYRAWKYSRVG